MADGYELLKKGLKINTEQEGLLLRAAWVVLMSAHVAWVCGWLAFLGLQTPFVQAGELERKVASLVAKQDATDRKIDAVDTLLRQQLAMSKAADIRYVLSKLCGRLGADRDRLLSEKERLQAEYHILVGVAYLEPPCEQLK